MPLPDFSWSEETVAFVNSVFPRAISFNSEMKPKFYTDVITVDSGHEFRNARWQDPLRHSS